MKKYLLAVFTLTASPALAAEEAFFSLRNTEFIVWLAFIAFVGILIYFKVPGKIGEMLDKRADGIKADLSEARALREEAQALLASYERKQKDVAAQADRIVAGAKEEAEKAAQAAKDDIASSVVRRLAAAEDQIASAQAAAIREIRDQAIIVAMAAAQEVIAKGMTAADGNKLIDDAIATVEAKLH